MDGYAATREVRRLEQSGEIRAAGDHIPIIAMTASAMAGDRDRCIENGMDDYLTKPASADALRTVLSRWIGSGPDVDEAGPGNSQGCLLFECREKTDVGGFVFDEDGGGVGHNTPGREHVKCG